MGATRLLKLKFTRPASTDLANLLSWIVERSPTGAGKVKARIRAVIDLIRRHPEAGRRTSRNRTRIISATPYPYLVFYTVDEDTITIHAVRHAARDPASMP